MKTIIAGSRDCYNPKVLENALRKLTWCITEVVCGMARGADNLGRTWGINNNIPVKTFPANWKNYGKRAGFMRNQQMAEYGEALVLLWDGKSRGSRDMLRRMIEQNKTVGNKPIIVELF